MNLDRLIKGNTYLLKDNGRKQICQFMRIVMLPNQIVAYRFRVRKETEDFKCANTSEGIVVNLTENQVLTSVFEAKSGLNGEI